ncbi:hypothetical protein [uncultured Corynebacterium sp.]|uniref:hypothetical protein n=1 Tax=uncultured Corynebacterium sp. TaxID=159447 RepID=UPI0025D2C9ED|nr:hypothetical protein [uncultured Corynebacterium sp.]
MTHQPGPAPTNRARLLGWALTAVAFLLAWAWKNHVFGSNGAGPWIPVVGTIVIALTVISLGTRARHPDLLVAGSLAFVSPAIALLAF